MAWTGGQGNNVLYDDTWYFNLTTFTWLPKSADVYPIYPAACTDDLEYIEELNCTHLQYPKHLERSRYCGQIGAGRALAMSLLLPFSNLYPPFVHPLA